MLTDFRRGHQEMWIFEGEEEQKESFGWPPDSTCATQGEEMTSSLEEHACWHVPQVAIAVFTSAISTQLLLYLSKHRGNPDL